MDIHLSPLVCLMAAVVVVLVAAAEVLKTMVQAGSLKTMAQAVGKDKATKAAQAAMGFASQG